MCVCVCVCVCVIRKWIRIFLSGNFNSPKISTSQGGQTKKGGPKIIKTQIFLLRRCSWSFPHIKKNSTFFTPEWHHQLTMPEGIISDNSPGQYRATYAHQMNHADQHMLIQFCCHFTENNKSSLIFLSSISSKVAVRSQEDCAPFVELVLTRTLDFTSRIFTAAPPKHEKESCTFLSVRPIDHSQTQSVFCNNRPPGVCWVRLSFGTEISSITLTHTSKRNTVPVMRNTISWKDPLPPLSHKGQSQTPIKSRFCFCVRSAAKEQRRFCGLQSKH